jgi:hypothetical protein
MSWIYINPFTGYLHISHLVIYESKSLPNYNKGDSIFLSADGVSVNLAVLKLLSKKIELSEVTIDQPKGIIIQNKNELNFTDLIKLFTPKKPSTTPSKFHFNILKIAIKNGTFYYREDVTPINYFIKEVNLESPGKIWDADTMSMKFSISSGPSTGIAKGVVGINLKTMNYKVATVIQNFDLQFMAQYLKDMINYGSFRASLDADIKSTGNFKDEEDMNAQGMVAVNDFHFGKNKDDDFASFDKLIIKIDSLGPKKHQYLFDSVSLIHPYFKYERYDYLDNLQRMFGINGSNISAVKDHPEKFNLIIQIADYVKVLAKNFFQSDYKINRLAIYKADLKFNDFAISEKFSAEINPLYFIADSINRLHKRVNVSLRSSIHPYGYLSVTLSINPKDKGDFDLHCNLSKIPATLFNPYLVTYSSYNLDRGTIEFNGNWNVRNGNIQSVNHLVIIDPRVTKRLRNKDTKWLPMPLIMSFIRERGNVIDYEIPITGDLKNPKFHLHNVLMDLLTNIFVKPATTPYRLQVKNMEAEIEKSLTLKWKFRQSSLLPGQEKFVNAIVDFLKENPEASISIYPIEYVEKEKEHILFFEAKKKYELLLNDKNHQFLDEDDSLKVDRMSVKDSLFVKYLNRNAGGSPLFTIQDKCIKFVGSNLVETKFNQLNNERVDAFLSYFKKKEVEHRVKIFTSENTVPYNGFSFYKIVYKADFPKSLLKAYQKMNELNDEAPRKKFEKERKQNKSALSTIKPKK